MNQENLKKEEIHKQAIIFASTYIPEDAIAPLDRVCLFCLYDGFVKGSDFVVNLKNQEAEKNND